MRWIIVGTVSMFFFSVSFAAVDAQDITYQLVNYPADQIDGVTGLRDSLVRHSDQFARVFTERMMTYALGRGVEYQDMPTLRQIVQNSAADKYRFTSLVMGIVKSPPFQTNMKTVESAGTPGTQQRASR